MVRDSNNSLGTAKRLGLNPFRVVERDRLGADDRVDFYQFRLDRSSFLNLSLRQFSGAANLELLDNSGSRIPLREYSGTGLDVLLSSTLDRGQYYLRVFNRLSTCDYRLRVNAIEVPDNGVPTPPAATEIFRSINFGSANSDPSGLVVVGNFLYFAADNGVNGQELFRTTGAGNNLTRIDINRSRGAGSDPRDLVNVNGTLYFSATNGVTGRELYRISGNATSATLVADLNPGQEDSNPTGLTRFNNSLYFTADRDNGLGRELYVTNGTSSGTRLVSDINSGSASSNPTDFAVVNNTLYFAATRRDVGRELFATNGAIGNVRLVADLNPGSTDEFRNSSIPTDLINVNNVLYFAATGNVGGRELWRYNPRTDDRPQIISNLTTSSDAAASANPGTDLTRLTSNDPTAIDEALANRPNRNRSAFAAIGNTLYFAATTRQFGRELYQSNGTFAGTRLVSNIATGAGSSNPTNLTSINNVLYFAANRDAQTGNELYRFSPANRRLVRVSDINTGTDSSDPAEFVLFRNRLIFVATSSTFGRELRALVAQQ